MSLRSPALHFVLIGAALFLLLHRRVDDLANLSGPRDTIVIGRADIAALAAEWSEQFGAKPDAAALDQLIQKAIDEEVLYREAMAQHLDQQAPIVRDRLVRLASFVEEFPGEDADALERAARRLGLQRQDVVIRRHLVQSMRLLLAHAAERTSESEIQAYYEQHKTEFVQPPRVHLTHVFISRDRAGADAASEATRMLESLRSLGTLPADAHSLGDPFLRGAEIGPVSDDELQRVFGSAFASDLHAARPGEWSGPLTSPYGEHLVWVHERNDAAVPALADVHAQVVHQYLAEHRQQRVRQRLDRLRKTYVVQIEPSEP